MEKKFYDYLEEAKSYLVNEMAEAEAVAQILTIVGAGVISYAALEPTFRMLSNLQNKLSPTVKKAFKAIREKIAKSPDKEKIEKKLQQIENQKKD
jgi:hypothetical protein